jgi:prepilin-type N-terminal cleavage/methylation domain-containing protein
MSKFLNRRSREGAPRGFTLIELLIVVAIIAILAAIAVPNFLQAQTRSKVSRVLSELRTMRTAAESYAVDYNRYPRMSWGSFAPNFNVPGGDRYNGEPIYGTFGPWMTTPVAYITRFDFFDPFVDKKKGTVSVDAQLYTYQDLRSNSLPLPTSGSFRVPTPFELRSLERNTGQYFLLSIGPSGNDQLPYEDFYMQYDATNGSISAGTIFVSQKHTDPKPFI